ncbi:ER membrane protein complex subunit 8 [Hondaea fermentalgiana]|uniref:ER membrane protein complex subunit 8 n=1 Tax=Hondaea fermentalgiana TaxID=2315210 RepID=A0A2R5GCS1_9STRA|nr:ER membrane protein complex subunit 8 [Hondaea fermentalgiana]|eukprot:GBG28365.1 ER membrane protein complex subunit 8 [Hondaea fermentalgiana]
MGDKVDEVSDLAAAAKEALAPAQGGIVGRQAHLKILLHAAKHPWAETSGMLIGTETKGKISVTDAIPFCHAPMMAPIVEIGTAFVEEYCKSEQTPEGSKIFGWFYATSRGNVDTVPKPTLAVFKKLQTVSGTQGTCLVRVLNKNLSDESTTALDIMTLKSSGDGFSSSSQWKTELDNTKEFTKLLKEGRQDIVFDMDDFMHDSTSDWRNLNLV